MSKEFEENKGSFNKRDRKELKEISKKGGIASGRARKERASLRKSLERFLKYKPTRKEQQVFSELVEDCSELTYADVIALTTVRTAVSKAEKGDTRLLEFIRDTSGEKPVNTLKGDLELSNRAEVVVTLPDNSRGDREYDFPFGPD